MTRRRSGRYQVGRIYPIRDNWFGKPIAHILITRKFQERLGDISEEDAKKEGGYTPETFRQAWIDINGDWNPDELVWVYEFQKCIYKCIYNFNLKGGDKL